MRSRAFLVLLGALVAAPFVLRAAAQDDPSEPKAAPALKDDRLVVHARGRAVVQADELELDIVVQGIASEAKGAEKKHRDRLRRILSALTGKEVAAEDDDEGAADDDEKAKDEKPRKKPKKRKKGGDEEPLPEPGVADEDGLVYEVREGRYTLGVKGDPTQLIEDLGEESPAKKDPELACGSCVHVTLRNLQKAAPKKIRRILARVLDRAAEAGADLGPPKTRLKPALRFRCSTIEAVKKQAYADAVAKAKTRAGDLAGLIGRTLGKVSAVTDVPEANPLHVASVEDVRTSDYETYLAILQACDAAAPETSSGSSEIAVEAVVEVSFELK